MALVEPIPIPNGETPPRRRGPGRPPKLNPDGTRISPPRASRPRGRKRNAPRSSGPRSLERDLSAFLTMVNGIVLMTPLGTKPMSASPMLGELAEPLPDDGKLGDELDAAEIKLLAGAIDAQCRRSPRFRKYVERFLGVGTGGQLAGIVAMIAVRRASRHGIVSPMIDPAIGILMDRGDLDTIKGMMTPQAEPDADTGEVPPNMANGFSTEGSGEA